MPQIARSSGENGQFLMFNSSNPTPGAAPQSELTGQVLFYAKPEPLNAQRHSDLRITRSETPFGFASKAQVIPLHVPEFGPAGLCYPIIFAGEDAFPVAVMGIRADENLFINDEGRFTEGNYIPAFIRRHPFVVAENPASDQLIVCIDRDAASLSPSGEVALFENGKPSRYTQDAVQFCRDFQTDRARTLEFVALLKTLDLLEAKQTVYTPPANALSGSSQPVRIADYLAVSVEKLNALPDDKLLELHKSGALQQIYAHIQSLFGWERIIVQSLARAPLAAA